MNKSLTWNPEPLPARVSHLTRRLAARTLRRASLQLDRWARSLSAVAPAAQTEGALEFHAEAGAPEGALYIDGKLLGMLPGVTRL